MTQSKNTMDNMLTKIVRDIEKLKEPVTENIEVFDSIIVAEQLHVTATATLSDPVEVTSIVGAAQVGFCEVIS